MATKTIRVDPEVYQALLVLKQELERERQRHVSMSDAVRAVLEREERDRLGTEVDPGEAS